MRRVALIDGIVVPDDEARVSVFDRGFLYGDSVFEVLRTYRGVAPFASEHLARLGRGCEALGIPTTIEESGLVDEVRAAIAAATLAEGEEAVLRMIVTRGEGSGLDAPVEPRPLRVITVEPFTLDEARLSLGITAIVVSRSAGRSGAASLKTGSYLANVLARRDARGHGADEAIFVEGDRILEAAGANVFARRGHVLFTAPDESGVLPGITRAHVARLARAEGMTMAWEAPSLERLEEVFVTSSVRGVVPIRRLVRGADVVFAGDGFPAALRLRQRFAQLAGALAESLKGAGLPCDSSKLDSRD